jgi:hypothetical protein
VPDAARGSGQPLAHGIGAGLGGGNPFFWSWEMV